MLVASINWRSGLRSEFLWSTGDAGNCVLWERLPQLVFADGTPWVELFAWAASGAADSERSVQRLLQHGWSYTNVAYTWLAAFKPTSSSTATKAFTVDSVGIISERQIEWLFQAAARTRRISPQRFPPGEQDVAAIRPKNIGPYPFKRKPPVAPATVEGRDIAEAFKADTRPKSNLIEAPVLEQLRQRRRVKAPEHHD